MKYRRLENSGEFVSGLALGIMIVDEDKPRRTSPDEGRYIIPGYLDAGGNYTRYQQRLFL